MKANQYELRFVNRYFWRTVQQQEVDYVEEYGGSLHGYEFKWNPRKKSRSVHVFSEAYPGSVTGMVTPENFKEFIGGKLSP
jgi:uncharacterized protein